MKHNLYNIIKKIIDVIAPIISLIIPTAVFERFVSYGLNEGNSNHMTNGETSFLKSISHNNETIILDVGGHEGNWADEAFTFFPKSSIHVFEPTVGSFTSLQKRLANKKVKLNHCGLGSEEGKLTINLYGTNSQLNSVYDRGQGLVDIKATEECSITTIDNYVKTNGIEHIFLLKIDTEGSEIDILKGAKNTLKENRIDYIQVEYNDTWIAARVFLKDLFAIAHENGYEVAKVFPTELKVIPKYDYRLERFRYANYILIKKGISQK